MKKIYLNPNQTPPKLPLLAAAFWFMFIQYYQLPEWLYGVWGLLFLSVTIVELVRLFTHEKTNLR